MSARLDGVVALITGGASGIGEATARRFTRDGAQVIIADRDRTRGAALAATLAGASFIATDVTREADIAAALDQAVERYGRVDCMINNAGITGAVGSIRDLAQTDWRATMAVLLDAVFFGIKHAARVMAPRRSGAILTTTSVAGQLAGLGPHTYTSAKHAVIGLTRSVASELAADNIRVNAVAPGAVATALSAFSRDNDMDVAHRNAQDRSHLDGAVSADEIAAAFAYLASADGAHVTGQVLVIDGGLSAFHPPRPGLHRRAASYLDPTVPR